jgi:hypothetical protein
MGGNTGGWLCSSSPEQVKTPWIQTFDPLSSGETRGWFSHFPSLEQVPHVSPFFVAHRFTSNDICPICTPVIGDIRDLTRSNIVLRHATVEWGNAVGGSTLFTLIRWLSHQTGSSLLMDLFGHSMVHQSQVETHSGWLCTLPPQQVPPSTPPCCSLLFFWGCSPLHPLPLQPQGLVSPTT